MATLAPVWLDEAIFNPTWDDTDSVATCALDSKVITPSWVDSESLLGKWQDATTILANWGDDETLSTCPDDQTVQGTWGDAETLNPKWLDSFSSRPEWLDIETLDPDFVDIEVISPSRFGMTAFNNSLKPIVRGDTRKVERTFTGLPTGITINKAWLTVKTTPSTSDPGLFQLEITTSGTSSGQITDASTSDGQLGMYFVINGTQSASATGGAEYVYDVQVKDASSGAIHTLVMGTVTFYDGVTGATS